MKAKVLLRKRQAGDFAVLETRTIANPDLYTSWMCWLQLILMELWGCPMVLLQSIKEADSGFLRTQHTRQRKPLLHCTAAWDFFGVHSSMSVQISSRISNANRCSLFCYISSFLVVLLLTPFSVARMVFRSNFSFFSFYAFQVLIFCGTEVDVSHCSFNMTDLKKNSEEWWNRLFRPCLRSKTCWVQTLFSANNSEELLFAVLICHDGASQLKDGRQNHVRTRQCLACLRFQLAQIASALHMV